MSVRVAKVIIWIGGKRIELKSWKAWGLHTGYLNGMETLTLTGYRAAETHLTPKEITHASIERLLEEARRTPKAKTHKRKKARLRKLR